MGELIYFPKVNCQPDSPNQNVNGEVIPFPIQDIKLHKYLLQYNYSYLNYYFLSKKYVAQLQHYYHLTEAKKEFECVFDSMTAEKKQVFVSELKLLEEARMEAASQLIQIRSQFHILDERLSELSEKSPVKTKSYHPQIKY